MRLLKIQGFWSEEEASCHISLLELQAIYSAYLAFQDHIGGGTVIHILMDNTTEIYYMNKLLCQEARKFWNLCIEEDILPTAAHVPSSQNQLADHLSSLFQSTMRGSKRIVC